MANSTNQNNSVQAKIDAYVKQKQQKQKKKDKKWYEEFINVERIKNVDSFGDALKVTGQTMLDTAGNAWQGIFQGAEGLADFAENRYADWADMYAKAGTVYYNGLGQFIDPKNLKFIRSAADALRKSASDARAEAAINQTQAAANDFEHILAGDLGLKKSDEEIKVYEDIHQDSALGDSGRGMVQSIALNATTAALNSASGGTLGIPLIAVSAAGNAEQEALRNGATAEEALTYGILSGSIEAGTELLFGGLGKISEGLGFGKGAVDDQLIKQLNKKIKSTAIKNLASYTIKAGGEGLEEVLAGLGNAYAKKLTYMSEEDIKKLIEDEDLLNSFIMGTLSSATMQAPSTITSTIQGRDVNTGLTKTQQQYVNEIAEQRLAAAQMRNEKLNRYQQMKIEDRTLQDFQENRLFDKSKLPMSDNVKDMDLQQSAVKYNIDPNAEAVVNVKAMLDKRGVKSRFDADAFKNVNGNAFWSNKNGVREVVFNPNASMDTIVEEVAIHELTHDLMSSTNSQSEINKQKIIDYVSTLDGYNEIRQNVENKYKNQTKGMSKAEAEAYIDEEIVADTLGKNIGSQEYVRQLVESQPKLSKVIYNWIVENINKLANEKGVKNEKLYWTNVKNSFEKAYNMDWEGKGKKGDTKYSFISEKGAENNKYLTKSLKYAKELRKKGLTNEKIRKQSGGWFLDADKNWKFEIPDTGIEVDSNILKTNSEYSLEELIPLNDLYKLYGDELRNLKVSTTDIKIEGHEGIRGQYDANAKTINIDNKVVREKDFETIRDILLHEVQHKIQELEGLEPGSESTNDIRYYTNSGEIEASDVVARSRKDYEWLRDNMPEMGKKYPIHKQLRDINKALNSKNASYIKNANQLLKEHPGIAKLYNEIYNYGKEGVYNRALLNKMGITKNSSFTEAKKEISQMLEEVARWFNKRSNSGGKSQYRILEDLNQELDNSSFSFDNQGRELTKEQQDYFKDSKVRDGNGNLKVLYNGSGNHTVYLPGFMSDESIWGKGIYLTPYKDIAQMYGNDVKETYVNITKPISHNTKMPFEQYNDFYKAVYDGEEAYREEYDMYDNDFDLLWDTTNKGSWADYANELKKYTDYDGIIAEEIDGDKSSSMVIAFQSNQIKNKDNLNPTDSDDIRKSQQNEEWQSFLDNNFNQKGTKTRLGDIKLPGIQEAVQTEVKKSLLPITKELKEINKNIKKVLNPNEISQLTPQDANTTPNLPGVNRNKVGDGKSSFFDNINNKVGMLNDNQKAAILSDEDVKYYDKVTNKDSLDKAFERLQENGSNESLRWFNKTSENADATDVAEGWILLKQYADSGNTEGMVEVAKKMREIGTKAGQTVQAFNILSRLTPEGMVKYAQSELLEAYDIMVKGKSAKWIEENRSKFELKPEEVQFIMDTMNEVATMEDGYDKKFKLAQIQKIMTDKLPPERGAGIKAWMRISMLFNPKTQVRNVAGNAIIAPVNAFGDLFASAADKLISAKTGVRTTGNINLKNYAKGMGTGLYQSYNDFKHGVNTRNIEGNRFEISQGRSFKDTNPIGKALNKVDSLLSFMLDAGDRGFYEAAFTNSINNQLVLNNTTEVTQDMIDIATQEALSRTWQDNNKYTKFVLSIRNQLNQVNVAGYGLGDILIPFAKTPANLTKAIVDYSPAGLIGTINKGIQLKKSLTNGQYNAQMQHDFVQSLGKAVAGTMLYVAGMALANAGVTTGESDEDKDTANFLKNTLGVNSYSIKIGDRTFTYDWAQPVAAPLAITANLVQKQKEEASLLENVTSTLDTAGNLLLEQSFMESISTVLNNNEGIATGIQEAILDLPARAVPTLFKQIVDITDGTQRQTFEKGKPLQSAVNSVKAKIPGLSQTLSPSVDTLGRDIEKYGGKNNIFNVFINPANVNTENVSESAAEIYKVYKATGETSVMPRVAPYTITIDNKKINLSAEDRTEYQRISGEIIENNVQNLISTIEYNNLPDKEKAEVIKNIVNYSYNIAQKEMYGKDLSEAYENAYEYSQIGDVSDYYTFKASIDDRNAQTKRISIRNYLVNSYLNDEQIAKLYGAYYSSESELSLMLNAKVPMKEYVKFNSEEFVSDYNNKGNAITNSRRNKMINYVNGLNLNQAQKVILIKTEYSSFDNYDKVVFNYINKLPDSAYNKMVMLKKVGFDDYDNQIIAQVNAQNISREEKIKKLKEMGFTIRNGRVYS